VSSLDHLVAMQEIIGAIDAVSLKIWRSTAVLVSRILGARVAVVPCCWLLGWGLGGWLLMVDPRAHHLFFNNIYFCCRIQVIPNDQIAFRTFYRTILELFCGI
jgi:hypothetical protein